jgi:hypothetical protein
VESSHELEVAAAVVRDVRSRSTAGEFDDAAQGARYQHGLGGVQPGVGHPVIVAELAADVQPTTDDERAGDGDGLRDVRGALERDAVLAVGAGEVRGWAVDPRGTERGERRAGGVDEVTALENGLRWRNRIRVLRRDGCGER